MSENFELDRAASGRVKVNVISIANLMTLIALLGVAGGTWSTLASRVDVIAAKVDLFQTSMISTRSDLQAALITRENVARELDSKIAIIGNRLTAVETILQRVERNLENRTQGSTGR